METTLAHFGTVNGATEAKVVAVSPTIAQHWLNNHLYSHQRKVNTAQAKYLAREMQAGNFRADTTINFASDPDGVHLIDGQHRLRAVIESNTTQRFVVVCSPTTNSEETGWMYGTTDLGRRRSTMDLFGSIELDKELGLHSKQLNALASAVIFIAEDFDRSRKTRYAMLTRDQHIALMRVFAPAFHDYLDIGKGMDTLVSWRALRVATLSVALVSLKWSMNVFQERVIDFWHGALLDDGIRVGDPRKLVYKHLVTTYMPNSPLGKNNGHRVDTEWSARYIARCFNASMAQEELKHVKSINVATPITIAGSPFNGKNAVVITAVMSAK